MLFNLIKFYLNCQVFFSGTLGGHPPLAGPDFCRILPMRIHFTAGYDKFCPDEWREPAGSIGARTVTRVDRNPEVAVHPIVWVPESSL